MELVYNKSREELSVHGDKPPLYFQERSTVLTNSLSYATYTLIFILFLQFYSKSVANGGKGGLIKKRARSKTEHQVTQVIYGLDDIKGPRPFLPTKLVGNFPLFLPFSETMKRAVKWGLEYPNLAKITGGNQTFIGLNSGPLVQQLLRSVNFDHAVKSPMVYDTMKPFITNGVLVSTGKFWQAQRKTLMKTQSFQSLKAYLGMLNKHSATFVQGLEKIFEDGKSHDINGLINITFLRVISEMITGFDVHSSNEFDRYHHNFQTWKESLIKRILQPWLLLKPLWKLHPMSRKHDKAVHEMFEFAHRRIREHRERRAVLDKLLEQQQKSPDYVPEVENLDKPKFRSVLDELLDAGVPDQQIVDEVNTMLFGGHETGASTIHFLCFAMALNPEIQELCRNEIDLLFDDPILVQNGQLTYDAVQSNLDYVERCILETLRLFPPVFLFLRKLEAPLVLEDGDKTFSLPKGVNVAVMPYIVHRNPSEFPEPEKFDPDRFLPEEVDKRHPFSFVPFSGGQRKCLGMKFAMIEMKVMVAYLLRNFVITTTDRMEDIPLLPFVTLTPARDYTFKFTKRKL